LGYSAQGFGKFGFYEIFKDVYKWILGPKAAQYQTIGFLTASACAEVIADTFLAPFEAVSYYFPVALRRPLLSSLIEY
jgi:solute carrier family 25 (mitochondrial phosphate transporter), member 3